MSHTLIYGGTFDPIHHGHLITCQRAREILSADRILLVPARISPHKTTRRAASGEHRLAMIHRAIADNAFFMADGRELLREGPSYTFDTLEQLRAEDPSNQLTLLIGADQLPALHTWHRVAELVDMIDIAVLGRPGDHGPIDEGLQQVATRLGPIVANRLKLLKTPLIEISATDIRERVREGLPVDYLVPRDVADYIRQFDLYRTD